MIHVSPTDSDVTCWRCYLYRRLSGVLGQKPSNRVLAFSLGFAAGIMLLISLMEMLPAALATEGMSPMLGYGMFVIGLLGYFALDRMLPMHTRRI